MSVGLVLSGGGARAAYQIGALEALAEITGGVSTPFDILVGLSAGAINMATLAAGADDFATATRTLSATWRQLRPESVYRTDTTTLSRQVATWTRDLVLGGSLGGERANYLLDTAPLRALLAERIDFARIRTLVDNGTLRGAALSATNYLTGSIVTFFDAAPEVTPWERHDRVSYREILTEDHVLASASIPLLFPPINLAGRPFGDGGVRMTTPLSAAIHMGADKLLAIGIRNVRQSDVTRRLNVELQSKGVTVAQIAGVLLNALFLDSLDNDMQRTLRINRTLSLIPEEQQGPPNTLRPMPALLLSPSLDLGQLASDEYEKLPAMLRHLLRGIGAEGEAGWDLLSYLAFQPTYIHRLIELGFKDTMARRTELEDFLA